MRAVWKGQVIADSDETIVVEGNHYFPRESLCNEFFSDSVTQSVCPWKGTAAYLSVTVDGDTNTDSAWFYPETKPAAREIENRVAFWKGVQVLP